MRKKLGRRELSDGEIHALYQNPIIKQAINVLRGMHVEVSCFSVWKYLSRQAADPSVDLCLEDLRFVYPLLRLVRPKKVEKKGWEQGSGRGLKRDKGQGQ